MLHGFWVLSESVCVSMAYVKMDRLELVQPWMRKFLCSPLSLFFGVKKSRCENVFTMDSYNHPRLKRILLTFAINFHFSQSVGHHGASNLTNERI